MCVGRRGFADWLAAAEPAGARLARRHRLQGQAGRGSPAARLPAAVLVVGRPGRALGRRRPPAALPAGDWRLDDPAGLCRRTDAAPGLGARRLPLHPLPPRRNAERPRSCCPMVPASRAPVRSPRRPGRRAISSTHPPTISARPSWPRRSARSRRASGPSASVIVGEDLLAANYPAIHAVGRASDRAPRLIDLRWGDAAAPKVTLVGKGVCFDTGGLDIKPSSGMLMMKKDMGGAALMLALARWSWRWACRCACAC